VSFKSCLLAGAAGTCLLSAAPCLTHAAPLVPGSGNEAVIEPAVPHPAETPCVVPLVTKATFGANAVPYNFTPPAACPGPWAKVILKMSISLNQGRQFDRSGQLFLAGVPLWFGTTAEPRATLAPYWSFEKDVTDYTALYGSSQTGFLQIANYQSSVYTSTITASATLSFYPATASAPAPVTADVVLPLIAGGGLATLNSGTDQLAATLTLPKNILHATLDLYLQGQSSDEFWYFCVPNAYAGPLESCGGTAFREGEVSIDGTPAGVAPIYPWIFTGGIDPYLWQPIPGVQTFDFTAFHVDLSPFAGILSNGSPHTIATSVYNADSYFSATGALRLFLDHGASTVTGSVTRNTLGAPAPDVVANITSTSSGSSGTIKTGSRHNFTITGTVTGSAGTMVNSVAQSVEFSNDQRFDVTAVRDLQILGQTTDISITTSSSVGGSTTQHAETLHYPLTIDYNFFTAASGNSTQYTAVNQQFLANAVSEVNGAPTGQSTLTDAILASDTLFFNPSFAVTGHNNQGETATYLQSGTGLRCVKTSLVATYNALTSVKTGC
jgi:hypothetical protein